MAAGTYHVFNPSTGQMAALPEGRGTARATPIGYGGAADAKASHSYASFALGYDTSTKKHKVVRIYYRSCGEDKRPRFPGCEVYVINSEKGLCGRRRAAAGRNRQAGYTRSEEVSLCKGTCTG
jgi:hypothetical protein